MDKKVQIESSLGALTVRFESATRATVSKGSLRAADAGPLVEGREVHVNGTLTCVNGVWGVARTDSGNESRAALNIYDVQSRSCTNSIKPWRIVRDAVVEAISKWAAENPQVLLEAEAFKTMNDAVRARSTVANLEAQLVKAKAQLAQAEEKRVAAAKAAGVLCEPPPASKPPLALDEETTNAVVSALRGVAFALEQSAGGNGFMPAARAFALDQQATAPVHADKLRVADKLRTVAAYIDGLAPTITVTPRKA